jgi:hypothetical protein
MKGQVLHLALVSFLIGVASGCPEAIPLAVPDAPANFTARATSSTTIELSWTPDDNAATYVLERSTSNGPFGPGTNLSQRNGPVGRYEDTALVPATSYTYRLTGVSGGGGGPSSTASATTLAPDAGSGDGSVQLSWTIFGADPRSSGSPCTSSGVDHVGVELSGQSMTAACSAGTVRIDNVPVGTSSLTAILYFGGGDGGVVADQQTQSVSATSGQLTVAGVDFHPI